LQHRYCQTISYGKNERFEHACNHILCILTPELMFTCTPMDNQTTCKCDAFTLDKLLQAHCMSRLFPYPLLCLPLLDYIVSLSLEIMQAIISHHVFHPRVQVYGNSEFKSYFISRADLCADAHPSKGSSACCALKEKRKISHRLILNVFCNV